MSQMQRAAVSAPTNIAEGSAKSSNKDFARFLEMSMGFLLELETELITDVTLKYIHSAIFENIKNKIINTKKKLTGFKNKLN